MTTLIIVRHGQSEANLDNLFTGQSDIPLTELGHWQAERSAEYLDRYSIDHIYSSDLVRARQTAEHTAARQNKSIKLDPAFREIYSGEWEGRHYEELPVMFPESFAVWKNGISRAHPDGGESVVELSNRVWEGVKRVLEQHRGECVAIFTHATPVRTLAWRWFGYDIENETPERLAEADAIPFCANASISIVEYDDDKKVNVVAYSYHDHLEGILTDLPRNLV